jgi:polyhydroxybutyrate depolymerase
MRARESSHFAWVSCFLASAMAALACSADDSSTTTGAGRGGATSTGSGGSGASGATGGSGGSSVTGSGGSAGVSTGGTGVTGGSAGTSATGGSAGSGTGGSAGSGMDGSAGSGTGGSAGSGTGGAGGQSDASVDDTSTPLPDTSTVDTRAADTTATGDARDTGITDSGGGGISDAGPSPGCGLTTTQSGTFMIDVGGTMRSYILRLPTNYDPNTPYRLIFAWHGGGGTATGVASGNYYGMDTTANANGRAIFIAPQGLNGLVNGMMAPGWANTNGQDTAFTRAMIAWASANLCIDSSRIFATGFSWGGMFSDTLGCEMPDVFRAVAPMAGRLCRGVSLNCSLTATTCMQRNVAAWVAHGASDTTVATSFGVEARDYFLALNHCTMTSTATTPSPCVTYGGCDSGYPVHYCEFNGGHQTPSFAGAGLWSFFSQF